MPWDADYNLRVYIRQLDSGKYDVIVKNANVFKVIDLELEVRTRYGIRRERIGSIDAGGEYHLGQRTKEYAPFVRAAYYEGRAQRTDPALFNQSTGVYTGTPHHALVWPYYEKERYAVIRARKPLEGVCVELKCPIRGPRVAISGHSFTGLWDSSYEYLCQLARRAGYNMQLAYSYWGGMGLGHHAGLIPGCENRAAQTDAMLSVNEYYDFYIVAGNSDEAISTASGADDYTQRENMLSGARILTDKAAKKGAKTILWATHPYRYGFFRDMSVKPWHDASVGDTFERDGKKYTLALSRREMMEKTEAYYMYMANVLGGGVRVAPVGRAYCAAYDAGINPYLPEGVECGDCGHQNNLGNLISASVLFFMIFGESPAGLGVPESHTWGMDGGSITPDEAKAIYDIAHRIALNYT